MKTELLEFNNKKGNLLRGILVSNNAVKRGVVFLSGFEKTAATDANFKKMSDKLIKCNIASFRFDYSGCGLSDGEFRYTSVKTMTDDLNNALEALKKQTNIVDISAVAHSISGCVVGNWINKNISAFSKIILIAPALNQKNLLRYWFVQKYMRKKDKSIYIDYKNYKKYLDENKFNKNCLKKNKMTRANYISKQYFAENMNIDYSHFFMDLDIVLHIHGDKDETVPLESLDINFINAVIVKNGNHDLQRPDMVKQYIEKAVNFIQK